MHRILSRPATEKLLIVVRRVSYLNIAQIKGDIYVQNTWVNVIVITIKIIQYVSAVFLYREKVQFWVVFRGTVDEEVEKMRPSDWLRSR